MSLCTSDQCFCKTYAAKTLARRLGREMRAKRSKTKTRFLFPQLSAARTKHRRCPLPSRSRPGPGAGQERICICDTGTLVQGRLPRQPRKELVSGNNFECPSCDTDLVVRISVAADEIRTEVTMGRTGGSSLDPGPDIMESGEKGKLMRRGSAVDSLY